MNVRGPRSPGSDSDGDDLDPLEGSGRPAEGHDGSRLGAFVPDLVRKAVLSGLGAMVMTEEGLGKLAGQLKLPKEVLGTVLAKADETKAEFSRVLGEEIRRFLNSELMRQEVLKMLGEMTIEIRAEVRLRPDPEAKGNLVPKVELTDTSVRRGDKKKKKDGA